MAQFSAHVSADQIVDEIRDDEEEMGEVIALIARQAAKLDEDDAGHLIECITPHASADDLRALAAMLVQAAIEKKEA